MDGVADIVGSESSSDSLRSALVGHGTVSRATHSVPFLDSIFTDELHSSADVAL